jgi:hypothetical protein
MRPLKAPPPYVKLSTVPVDKSVDEVRECRPSAESAEEFYEMITKSPLPALSMIINRLYLQPAFCETHSQCGIAVLPAVLVCFPRGVHIFLQRVASTRARPARSGYQDTTLHPGGQSNLHAQLC